MTLMTIEIACSRPRITTVAAIILITAFDKNGCWLCEERGSVPPQPSELHIRNGRVAPGNTAKDTQRSFTSKRNGRYKTSAC